MASNNPPLHQTQPLVFLVTGGRGAGKTSFCQTTALAAQKAGWNVAGILSIPRFEHNHRTQLDAQDLRSRESRLLANRRPEHVPGQLGWDFDQNTLAWANVVFARACPCDLLIIDELGPLELERGEGWLAAFSALDSGQYRAALVVVRPHLLLSALDKWGDARIIEIETPEESAHKAAEFIAGMI